MNILQISPHYVPAYHYGGVQHVAHSLSKEFLSQGHQVRVCTTNLKDRKATLDVDLDKSVDVDGVSVYYAPVSMLRYWGFSPVLASRVWIESRWADVVLLHFHYQFSSMVSGWINRFRKKPYIIFSHGCLNRYSIEARSTVIKKYYLNLLERGNFRNALFTVYHSLDEMENSFQFGRCRVVSNGIYPREFIKLPEKGYFRKRYPETKNRIILFYLGRLGPGKGLDLLLPAFRQLIEKRQDLHLVLAGGNERGYGTIVRNMINQMKITENVTLTGLITGPLKLGALQDSDVYVLPSQGEGMSIAMLEAMYMGLPVVVSDRVGLCYQILKVNAGIVVPLEINKLANALFQMAGNSERKAIGLRGRRLVESQYTWEKIAYNLVAQVQELIP